MAAATSTEGIESTHMSEKTKVLFDQLDKYLTDRLQKSTNADPLRDSYHPIPSLKIDVDQLRKRQKSHRLLNGYEFQEYQNGDASDLFSRETVDRKHSVPKMKFDYETDEDIEVAQYLKTALEVQPGLNWRLLALRRQASIRNGGNSYDNCNDSPKHSVSACQRPGSSTLGTDQIDLDSQYVRKRLEREQKQRQSQQRWRPEDKLILTEHTAMSNGDSGKHDSVSFQDLRVPRRTYSIREPSERRTCSAAPNGQSNHASMQPGEKSAAQNRRVSGTAAKPEATSTLQRRLTYDPHSSKVIARPTKQSNDKGASAAPSPEVKPKQNQATSKEAVPFRRTPTCRIPNNVGIRSPSTPATPSTPSPPTAPASTNGRPAVNGQVPSRKESRPRMASPTPRCLSTLSPPPPPIRGHQNGQRPRPLSTLKSPSRVPTPSSSVGHSQGLVNGHANPLRQSQRERIDKPPGQNSPQRVNSKTPSSKERQGPTRVVSVHSHYPDMAVESINVKLERLTTHVLELRRRVERDYAESGSCSPGDDIYGDEEVGATRSGRATGMHPVVASSLKNIRVLEANIQEIFDLLYPNEVEIWSPQLTRQRAAF